MAASHHRLALLLATAFGAAWLGAAGLILVGVRLPAEASGPVLAVFAPGLDSEAFAARISNAGGIPLQQYGVAFAWTAYSRAEGFVGRLQEQGALLVIPPIGTLRFSGICGGGTEFWAARSDGTGGAR